MTILDIPMEKLMELNHGQAEELVWRLVIAELDKNGYNVREVEGLGDVYKGDGGCDVKVNSMDSNFSNGFIPSADSVFQVKTGKHEFDKGDLAKEMCPLDKNSKSRKLKKRFPDINDNSAAYIIVHIFPLDPDVPKKKEEIMREIINENFGNSTVNLKFYDLRLVHQWLLLHRSVQMWVRSVLNIELYGWQPYGNWSNAHKVNNNSDIYKKDDIVISFQSNHYKISEAFSKVKDLLLNNQNSIRIVGHSGVGKTHFLQTLFDEDSNEDFLEKVKVIYGNCEDTSLEPRVEKLFEQLSKENESIYLVLDNCSSDMHERLSKKNYNKDTKIKLVTVEQDIRTKFLDATDVFHMRVKANKFKYAEEVIKQNYPKLDINIAKKIAENAFGNSGLALKIVRYSEITDDIENFDCDEFYRRFFRHTGGNGELEHHAKILSLVYSFNNTDSGSASKDLQVLSEFTHTSREKLFISVAKLIDSEIILTRNEFCALLPPALANYLTKFALNETEEFLIQREFNKRENYPLLFQFSRRLGMMSKIPEVTDFVSRNIKDGGIFEKLNLDEKVDCEILENISKIIPHKVLKKIENYINSKKQNKNKIENYYTISKIIQNIAINEEYFEKCIDIIIGIIYNNLIEIVNYYELEKILEPLFLPYFWGTMECTKLRAKKIKTLLSSSDENQQIVGLNLLAVTFSNEDQISQNFQNLETQFEYGNRLQSSEYEDWLNSFIDLVEEFSQIQNNIGEEVICIFANHLNFLWTKPYLQERIRNMISKIRSISSKNILLKEVRKIIYDYENVENINDFYEINNIITPTNVTEKIMFCLTVTEYNIMLVDEKREMEKLPRNINSVLESNKNYVKKLAKMFSRENKNLGVFGNKLFSGEFSQHETLLEFGKGLAEGATDKKSVWDKLVEMLTDIDISNFSTQIFSGYLETLSELDPNLRIEILDSVVKSSKLKTKIVELHFPIPMNNKDIDRCTKVLRERRVDIVSCSKIFDINWNKELSKSKMLNLATLILESENGESTLIDAIGSRLKISESSHDPLGPELRKMAMESVIRCVGKKYKLTNLFEKIDKVLSHCFEHHDCDDEIEKLLKIIVEYFDGEDGHLDRIVHIIWTVTQYRTQEFLDYFWCSDELKRIVRTSKLKENHAYLSKVNIDIFIQWCKSKDDDFVWEELCQTINLLAINLSKDTEETYVVNQLSLEFIKNCPNPELIVEKFAIRIKSDCELSKDIVRLKNCISVIKKIKELELIGEETENRIVKNLSKCIKDIERKKFDSEKIELLTF